MLILKTEEYGFKYSTSVITTILRIPVYSIKRQTVDMEYLSSRVSDVVNFYHFDLMVNLEEIKIKISSFTIIKAALYYIQTNFYHIWLE